MIATVENPTLATLEPDAGVLLSVRIFRAFVKHRARGMAPDDRDLRSDLVQEGMIGLWEADPSRLDFTVSRDRRYATRAILRRMWSLKRREERARGQRIVVAHRLGGRRWLTPSAVLGSIGVVRRNAGAE